MALMTISTILTGVNIMLILSLLYVYISNYSKLKSMFTLGLGIFAVLFLIQNVISFYYFVTMMPYYAASVEGFVFAFSLLQTLAFVVLNYITWK